MRTPEEIAISFFNHVFCPELGALVKGRILLWRPTGEKSGRIIQEAKDGEPVRQSQPPSANEVAGISMVEDDHGLDFWVDETHFQVKAASDEDHPPLGWPTIPSLGERMASFRRWDLPESAPTIAHPGRSTAPLTLLVDKGAAPPEDIAELLTEISTLYRMIGGSGINFTVTDVRCPEPEMVP